MCSAADQNSTGYKHLLWPVNMFGICYQSFIRLVIIVIIIIIIIIVRLFTRRNMSESLQGHRTTSNANTWVANSYYIL